MKLAAYTDNVFGECSAKNWVSTYADRINRPGRLVHDNCLAVPDNLKNKVILLDTWGRYYSFYADNDYKASSILFSIIDREDWQLIGKGNDNVEAVWCTFEAICRGASGAK